MKLSIHKVFTIVIALVWLVNGLYAKLLSYVPRHEQIVAEVLGIENPRFIIILIGIAEIIMALWILSGIYSKLNTVLQSILIITMNILEYIFVPDLLLWGKLNIVFALLFVIFILSNEFYLKKRAK